MTHFFQSLPKTFSSKTFHKFFHFLKIFKTFLAYLWLQNSWSKGMWKVKKSDFVLLNVITCYFYHIKTDFHTEEKKEPRAVGKRQKARAKEEETALWVTQCSRARAWLARMEGRSLNGGSGTVTLFEIARQNLFKENWELFLKMCTKLKKIGAEWIYYFWDFDLDPVGNLAKTSQIRLKSKNQEHLLKNLLIMCQIKSVK